MAFLRDTLKDVSENEQFGVAIGEFLLTFFSSCCHEVEPVVFQPISCKMSTENWEFPAAI